MDIRRKLLYFSGRLRRYYRGNARAVRIVLILLAVMWMTARVKGCIAERKASRVPPRPVSTAVSRKADVPVFVSSFGSLTSPNDVDIRAQVTGRISEVNYEQGASISKGDLLFTIDPREYAAAVKKSEAELEQAKARAELERDLLERNRRLFEKELIAEQEYEQIKTSAAEAAANVQLRKAALDLARIDLDYCYIRSPINGLAGKRRVDVGNIVQADTGPVLVNIKSMNELYIDFTLAERHLDKVRDAMKSGELKVEILQKGQEGRTHSGELDFIDNRIDPETGTFALRARVDNPDLILWPGRFVEVRLYLKDMKDAVVIPFKAAQIGKQGYYLFVVGPDQKAELRDIKVGPRYRKMIVVKDGLDAGQTVVTEGQLSLRSGAGVIDVGKLPESERPPGMKGDKRKSGK
jgi:multidrug efflux system membrane fusion protein